MIANSGCFDFFQGMVVNGFVNAVISTLERRFDLVSTLQNLLFIVTETADN